jgi:hypothetical protein
MRKIDNKSKFFYYLISNYDNLNSIEFQNLPDNLIVLTN